jgi:hypothetical protein
MKRFVEYLAEAIGDGPRIPHPEDAIFSGSDAAMESALALQEIVNNPSNGTIKWDGGIALYFGNNERGEFFITDKYMPAKGVYPTSPDGWREYDATRGANRNDLYQKIETLWDGLKKNVGNSRGIFKGDLMAINPTGLKSENGAFVFSPTTVKYTVPENSYLGNLLKNKVALLVVHEYDGAPWDGKSGMTNTSNVAVVSPNAGNTFDLPNKNSLLTLVRKAITTITQYGKTSDDFISGLDNVARKLIAQYLNHVRTKQTSDDLPTWLEQNANKKQYNNLIGSDESGYLIRNRDGLMALNAIWKSIFDAKMAIVNAFENQISGFKQETVAGPGGEGIVFSTSKGLIKLINPNFGIAHFSKEH